MSREQEISTVFPAARSRVVPPKSSSVPEKSWYSAEDRIFYGTILGISDMVEFQSENAKDLEDEFHQAVDEYLEFCKEIGKDPQKE